MKRIATIVTASMLVLSLAACGGSVAASNDTEAPAEEAQTEEAQVEETQAEEETVGEAASGDLYTYEGIEFWDVEQEAMGGMTQRDIMTMMAKPDTDMDAFVHSYLGEWTLGSFQLTAFGTIDNPEVANYWEAKGMVHEAHDVDDADHQWASLVPADLEEGKAYPLLFVWHGNNNSILLAESYGFSEAAAQKDWIVVFPWAANDDEYLAEFDRILAFMVENYPVDVARIYTTGFSKGGRVSAHLALERADVLAAAAPCGTTAAASFYNPDGSELPLSGPEELTAADFEAATGLTPVQFFGGEHDVFGAMPYDADYKIAGVNGWLGLQGNDNTQSLEASKGLLVSAENETEQSIGLSFDQTDVIEQDGMTYHVGSYLDADGNATVRIVECDGAIHWPTPYMGQIALDFMEQFSR